MHQFDQEQLLRKYQKLPQSVQDAMFAESSSDKIRHIGKKHGLLLDKTGVLAEQIGYFMLGLTHPKDFTRRLSETLGVPHDKAKEIAADVNNGIFQPIRNDLRKIYDGDDIEQPSGNIPRAPQKNPSFAEKSHSFAIPKPPEQTAKPKEEQQARHVAIPEAPKKNIGGGFQDPYREPLE